MEATTDSWVPIASVPGSGVGESFPRCWQAPIEVPGSEIRSEARREWWSRW